MSDLVVQLVAVQKAVHSPAGHRQVLNGIDLSVNRGERVAFVGPNGSGKTTLLRVLLGADPADSGKVSVNSDCLRGVSYVPQDYRNALFPWLRLSTNLTLAFSTVNSDHAPPTEESYKELEQTFCVSLDLDKYPYQLSGGEQQIFVLSRAILTRPSLLILDEALSAVDYGRRRRIQEFLGAWLPETGCTFICATHDFEEAVLLSDRVLAFDSRTGTLAASVDVPLGWPRGHQARETNEFRAAVEHLIETVL